MLEVENIKKKYGNVEALKGLTFQIDMSEILAIVGPSGCGKTTLLRLIAGFEKPDEGKVTIDCTEVSNSAFIVAPSKRKLSLIFQDLALWPHMTVREQIEFVLNKNKTSKNGRSSEIKKVLRDVNLNGYNKRYPHELSGGEKQRLAIARALASKPNYLLMDEPFSSLDSILKEELQDMVINLKNNLQMSIIYVTHNIEEALVLADRMAIMNKGKIEQLDNKDKILSNPKNEFVKRLLRIK